MIFIIKVNIFVDIRQHLKDHFKNTMKLLKLLLIFKARLLFDFILF